MDEVGPKCVPLYLGKCHFNFIHRPTKILVIDLARSQNPNPDPPCKLQANVLVGARAGPPRKRELCLLVRWFHRPLCQDLREYCANVREGGETFRKGQTTPWTFPISSSITALITLTHPPTHQSARWSADPANIQTYLDNGRRMDDVRDVPLREAARDVPAAEARDRTWPYEEL